MQHKKVQKLNADLEIFPLNELLGDGCGVYEEDKRDHSIRYNSRGLERSL